MMPKELREWRNKHSLTQAVLGELLGVSNICVYRWETGRRNIPPFLHLALERLEQKGGIEETAGKRKGRR
jgi:DNA-binding XRE family transcriptional regulator